MAMMSAILSLILIIPHLARLCSAVWPLHMLGCDPQTRQTTDSVVAAVDPREISLLDLLSRILAFLVGLVRSVSGTQDHTCTIVRQTASVRSGMMTAAKDSRSHSPSLTSLWDRKLSPHCRLWDSGTVERSLLSHVCGAVYNKSMLKYGLFAQFFSDCSLLRPPIITRTIFIGSLCMRAAWLGCRNRKGRLYGLLRHV